MKSDLSCSSPSKQLLSCLKKGFVSLLGFQSHRFSAIRYLAGHSNQCTDGCKGTSCYITTSSGHASLLLRQICSAW